MFFVYCKALFVSHKSDICFNTVQIVPSYCVWKQKTEADRNRCDVVFVVKVLYCVSYGLIWSPSCSGFSCHLQGLSVPVGEEEAVGDRLCHSLLGLVVTIPPLSKALQQKGWWGIVGDVCGSLEGACEEALDIGEGMTPESCGAAVPLCHPPGTGPSHLIRLDVSGSVMWITAERQTSSSPETAVTLYPEGLKVLLQYLVILWCLYSNHFWEWISGVVWQ